LRFGLHLSLNTYVSSGKAGEAPAPLEPLRGAASHPGPLLAEQWHTHTTTHTWRRAALSQLGDLDLLVIGGGIVGAGVARDAAMRGLRVGLVEQDDFASGTSSRSSRLLHGGLRYLAQGRVGLVREASIEKRTLHRIAPHLASPLAFVFPSYGSRWRGPWALKKLRLGVKLYDLLCGGRNLGSSSVLDADEVARLVPGIDAAGLTGGVRYFDALTSDARLVLDTLRSAARYGAVLVNYCRFGEATPRSGGWTCTLHDLPGSRDLSTQARCIVNAAGPWADKLRLSSVRLRLTKGVHVVIDRARLPIQDAVVMTQDDRILFATPWGERVILGTTDTDYTGAPDAVAADQTDIKYILNVVNRAFPGAYLHDGDVISTYAGVRPLIASSDGGPSDISRSHQIASPQPGWWDVSGGKLTTYRLMAEQVVDRIERHLGRRSSRCATADTPLLEASGGMGNVAHASREAGAAWSGILPPPFTRGVVEHCCHEEWAVHLEDVMIRRTSWSLYHRDHARMAAQVAGWMADALSWDENIRAAELRAYCAGGMGSVLAARDAGATGNEYIAHATHL
jgi:glycerol-3-phosphate dehydrogenase